MSFIVGSCDGDGVAKRKLSIQQTFTVDRSEAWDSYSRTTFPGGTPYPPVEGLYVPVWGEAVLYPAEESWDRKRMCFMCITLKLVKIYIRYRRSISHYIVREYRLLVIFFLHKFPWNFLRNYKSIAENLH